MNHNKNTTLLSALCILCTALMCASEPFAERDFGFQPLEIYEFRHGTSDLFVCDFNNDGLDDIIFINNQASRVEVLLRKPEKDNGLSGELPQIEDRFENIGIVVDQEVMAFCVADFDGDSKPGLLTIGKQLGLLLRKQGDSGHLTAPEKIYLTDLSSITGLNTADLNNNKLMDIIVPRRNSIEILWNDKTSPFTTRSELKLSAGEYSRTDIADINADGNADILIYMNANTFPLRAYMGDGSGNFGAENMIAHPPARLVKKISFPDTNGALTGSILPNGDIFRLSEISSRQVDSFLEQDEILPLRIPLHGISRRHPVTWAVTDINADNFPDLCVAAPELSQIHFFQTAPDSISTTPLKIDSLSGVTLVTTDCNGNIIAYSPSEKAAAIHSLAELENFPAILPSPDETHMIFAHPGKESYFCLTRKERQNPFKLETRNLSDDSPPVQLDGELDLSDPPDYVKAFTIDSDNTGLIFFFPYRPPEMFIATSDTVTETPATSFRALTHTLPPAAFDFNHNDKSVEISVAQGKVIRSYRLNNGEWTPFRQYNPENENAKITSCAHIHQNKDKKRNRDLFAYDNESGHLIFNSHEGKLSRKIHIPFKPDDFQGLVALGNPSEDTLILGLIARENLYILRDNAPQLESTAVAEYSSPSEKPSLRNFETVFVGADMRPLVCLTDTRNRSLELVAYENESLKEQLIFEVFNDSAFSAKTSGESYEPKAVASGDLNGDGIGDIVVLVHDKLIVYLGE